MNEEILRVTPDGEFIWHNNADKLIETGDFTEAPAMPHILRRLRRLLEVKAQRDALLEALRKIGQYTGEGPTYSTPWQDIVADLGQTARAAIKAVEEGK